MSAGRPFHYKLIGRLAVPCADLMEWARWFERAERIVAKTDVGALHVSTVFLGLDHSLYGDAILFETMIFGADPNDGGWQTRCATWDQAQRQHAAAVAHAQQLVAKAEAAVPDWQNEGTKEGGR